MSEQLSMPTRSAVAWHDEILAVVDLELRESLHVIGLHLGTVRRGLNGDGRNQTRQIQKLDAAEATLARAMARTARLLKLAELKPTAATPPHADLPACLHGVLEQARAAAAERNIRLEYAGPSCRYLPYDAPALECLVGELVVNAIEHAAGRCVTLTLRTDQPVEIEIADDGKGIGLDGQKLLTDRLHRPDLFVHRLSDGIGLWIAGSLGRRLGLRFRLESAVDGGSRFVVILP